MDSEKQQHTGEKELCSQLYIKNVKKYSLKACSQEILSVVKFNIQLHFHKKAAYNLLPNFWSVRLYRLEEYEKEMVFNHNSSLDV